ncbi:hypothetical protein A2U94_19970 [Bacillus sp. VT 712]|uniref:hypothetical protein n=1 Tax=Bacillaceae TaxID=186817 RepID=UPI000473A03D|nr:MULTISPECIES: hypothetical protein [Bacillaceae]KZB89749.1 hypothetical protein A2U94_19970 [Bacillus sp. VT 712]
MDHFTTFDYLRPIFITFIVLLILLFIAILQNNKRKLVNTFSVFSISVISVLISGITLFVEGSIVDDLNLSGDSVSTYLFFIIVILCIVNLFFYFRKSKN